MNKIMLIGHLGRDPEANHTTNGTAVTKFTLAVTRTFTTSGGEAKQETDWFMIIAWQKLADICHQYLKKGKKVYVEGRLTQRKYTDREGVQRVAVEVIANEVELLSPRQQETAQAGDEEIEALLADLERQAE